MEKHVIEGQYRAPRGAIAIVAARFNAFVVDSLLAGAQDMLFRHGVLASQIHIIRVPGAYELPLVCQQLAKTGRYQGIIALGAVIRGATPHFDYVAGECARGLMKVSLKAEIPVAFGVLTTDTIEQAVERSGTKAGNKGADSAMVLLEMIDILEQVHG